MVILVVFNSFIVVKNLKKPDPVACQMPPLYTTDETIDICVNQLFGNTDTVEGFTKSELKQLLCLVTKETYFVFNGLLYKQIDGVAMGSSLGPSLANAFVIP